MESGNKKAASNNTKCYPKKKRIGREFRMGWLGASKAN
jgi:hypothetical protein